MSNPAFEFVRQLGTELAAGEFDLPPFPDTAMRVQRCVSDPESDINALGIIIAGEPALAARLMRMANSAMMRRGPMEVTDINTAISRVGMDMVQNAAVSFAAREAFNFPAGSPFIDDLNKLRQHSVKVASLSYVLGKHSKFAGKPDEAMLAGLLHAVGKFYILTKASDHQELFSDRDALDSLMAQWHTGVARAIVESWNFPESIAIGVDEQELKERDRISAADVSDVLFIANILARAGVKVASELGDLDALARLRMDSENLAQVLEENEDEIQSMVDALSG
ncbi:HDOD domain-containing protein [Congregibacter sp.]|uniref:HDOD domain-containing protein n=1 Tax=Congregibacter sp. TaxID=2744308 RepID=UPI00385A9998